MAQVRSAYFIPSPQELVLGSLGICWYLKIETIRNNYPGEMNWPWEEHIHDRANRKIKDNVPLICVVIFIFGFLHFIFTLFYVRSCPYVWNLSEEKDGTSKEEKNIQNTLKLRPNEKNQIFSEDILSNYSDFEGFRAQCGGTEGQTFQHRVIPSPVKNC